MIDASSAIASSGYKVLVMDTGVEKSHPDLNVVEFIDYVDEPGTPDHGIDGHGHGTHVGGECVSLLSVCVTPECVCVDSTGSGEETGTPA